MILDHSGSCIRKLKDENDVARAFSCLSIILEKLFDGTNFKQIYTKVITGAGYPPDFVKQMKVVENFSDILCVSSDPYTLYCNWLNIRLLKKLVEASKISEAQRLVEEYEGYLHSKTVVEVRIYFQSIQYHSLNIHKVALKVNRSDMLSVYDVTKYSEILESDLNFPEGSITIVDCNGNSLTIQCIFPSYFEMMFSQKIQKDLYFKFRKHHIQYVQFEKKKIHAVNLSLQVDLLRQLESSSIKKCKCIIKLFEA